jgi:ATP-binding cassette subfamily B protein
MQLKKILGYYWPHIKKYKWSFTIPFIFYGIATVVSQIGIPLVYKQIIDIVSTSDSRELVATALLLSVGVLALIAVTENVFFRAGDYMLSYVQSRILKAIADSTFSKLHSHSYKFFNDTFSGALVAKVKRFVDSFETLHDTAIFHLWMNSLVLVGIFCSLMWFAPLLGVMFLGWLALFIVVTAIFTKYKSKKDLIHAEAQSDTTGALSDIITNVVNVKMFSTGAREEEYFKGFTRKQAQKRSSAWNFQNHQFFAQSFLITFFEVVAMYVAIKLWIAGSITAGTIVLLQAYLIKLFDVVWNMGRNAARVVQALADAQEMVDIFETPLDVVDVQNPENCKITEGNIEIQNMSFSYYGSEDSVFNNFSLNIKSGEKIGLVGHSGSGKTTITKLLLRFMDINGGEIRIDGQNISQITQSDLRRNISYVPQDPILFHRSLRENIMYGKNDATEEEMVEAAKAANAHEFISSLPDGYNTLVGERGVKLSGGERQRVAIARAMLKDAPILILDEATSALDSISERHIQEAFERLMEGRTTLVVAHRLSTIQKMDRIVVFDNGSIVEEGSHTELIKKNNGVYAGLWKEQSSGFIE